MNSLPVGRLPRTTIPDTRDRPSVRARIVSDHGETWVDGTAHAWTRSAVCIWWTDPGDRLQRIDWLAAGDVRRA